MSSNFFAMVNRMKLIDRWALMNNTTKENIAEHSHSVAVIAHALALIGNKKFGKSYNAERAALLALYHDTTEVITGDMPTPVKYYNDDIKNVYKNIRMLSYQDTYYSNNNRMRSYFEDSEIHGTVDFICGGGDVFFNRTLLYLEDRSGNCITAPAGDTEWGYVFNDCTIDGYDANKGSYALGRPWQGAPMSVWINTTMKVLPKAEGWSDMSETIIPKLFAEYNSHTESGMTVDCSARKTKYTGGTIPYSPVLTQEEASRFTLENVLSGSDSWQPALLTEQAAAPVLTVNGTTLSWNASDYVFCYAICKNGKVIDFTNETSYTIPADATDNDVFTVRAANQMGGLGQPSNNSNATGIEQSTVAKEIVERQYFNVNGIRLNKAEKGLNILRTIYSDGSIETVKEFVK